MIECEDIPQSRNEIPSPEMCDPFPHLQEISSKIPPVDHNANIEILIRRDAPEILKVRHFKNGPPEAPWAHKHILGWTLSGEVCLDRVARPVHISSYQTELESPSEAKPQGGPAIDDVDHDPKSEHIPCPNYFRVKEQQNERAFTSEISRDVFIKTNRDEEPAMSVEDRLFVEIMEKGIHKNEPLPFSSPEIVMPNNKKQALDHLYNLKRSFHKKPQMQKDYVEFMAKIIARGHAVPIPPEEVEALGKRGKVCYLPHFGVYASKKPTQIRVVFDSSCEFEGVSLNKVLLSGPDMMNSLIGVLMRFRLERISVVSDIEQMFHSFYVTPEHRDYLRFLWFKNDDPNQEIQEFRMKVHIFGNGPSPAVATLGLRVTATHGKEFGSEVKEFVCRDFYVDDGLTSRKTEAEAIDQIKRAQTMLSTANLRLHKIASNSFTVMEAFNTEDRAKNVKDLELRQDTLPAQRSLGVLWDLQNDTFTFKVNLQERPFTRRGVLSVINSYYDPLGLAAPVILVGKLLLQQLVAMGKEKGKDRSLRWDDPLPEHLKRRWGTWKDELTKLENVAIPLCYHPEDYDEVKHNELHAFSDASKEAVGTAVYLRQVDKSKRVSVALVYGQAKVAPIQPTSIPRLELCAAVLSTQAISPIKKELVDLKIETARRFYLYVANQVQYIRSMSEPAQWKYVRTSENPADLAKRGIPTKDLAHSMWFNGPPMLGQPTSDSTVDGEEAAVVIENDPEVRKEVTVHANKLSESESLSSSRFECFSCWSRLREGVACLISKARRHSKKHDATNKITLEEQAEKVIIRATQGEPFAKEIRLLNEESSQQVSRVSDTRRKELLRNSDIRQLSPFLDQEDILRVGGRLHHSDLSFAERHPILLPKNHNVTKLIIRHYHQRVHHQGRVITQGEIRRAGYWIIGGHNQISKVLRSCVTCNRLRGKCLTQRMADLPADQAETGALFSNVGVDVFGSWIIQTQKLRGKPSEVKCWGVLFTCLVSRAVHLEVLHSMDASSFICALRRFIAIRGPVALIWYDCGTNFVGAKLDLAKALNEMNKREIARYLRDQECKWEFNLPHPSHFGGVWERQIGTIRRVLDAMLLGIDTEEPIPLTPSTLLTLKRQPVLAPPGKFVAEDVYARKRWRRVQYLAEQIWVRWKLEYLQNLQRKKKWIDEQRDLVDGDVVLMKDNNELRNAWPMGIVREAIKSADGKVRKAKVELFREGEKRIFLRPIGELILLMERDGDK
ncbi:uncharacterized protein LOC114526789 [Dendronephthya gigantea]|uniref:uncharacterized protein LOC114526789 n=1 Tax=Dendronephthya gigantea TaxID=151771 RepID=UPI00106C6727|nr:uncharacterized protein LOC114526789 [Dendronephthya gigantea]